MKRKALTDSEQLYILRRFTETPKPSQEEVAEATRHRKTKIGEVLKRFKTMDWEYAKAFCSNDQRILALRDDYAKKKVTEAKDYEETLKENVLLLRHELGLPRVYHFMKDGHWHMEF